MRKYLVYLLGVFGLMNSVACVSTNLPTPLVDESIIENVSIEFPKLNYALFGESPEIISNDKIFELSDHQLEDFLNFYKSNRRENQRAHIPVYEYLKNIGERFTYLDETLDAKTTLGTESGNCMSLAILTTALARAAKIEIDYQLVNRLPIYQEFGSLIFNAQHIRSVIYEPLIEVGSGLQFSRSKTVIDYYPSRYSYTSGNVSEEKFIGMYYQNLAAEALGKNDFTRAFWLLNKSLEVDKNNAEAINSMAVLNRRVGDDVTAEELYKYGIKHAGNKVSLLRNYHILLELQNRTADAARVAKELEGLEDLNPFRWLHAANDAYAEADYQTAIDLYEKAVEMAPYLHQGYFGIAKSEFQLGNYSASGRALDKAREEAFDIRAKDLYQAKLYALNKVRFN